MVTATSPETATPADKQAQAVETAAKAAVVQVNQGNTVRASWRFSMDNVRTHIAHMSPEAKELLVWAFQWCINPAHPVLFEEFCDRVQYAPNTIYKIYSGKYKHPESGLLLDAPDKLIKAIRSFRRLEIERAKLGTERFVHTPTAQRIYWAIDQARKSGRPVMIYGGSQLGKTEAFKQNTIDFNHGKTVLIEIEAVNGLKGLLQAIAEKLGISPNANTPDLIARIKKALTKDMVLILDEVHLLANVYRKGSFFACMEELRRIWDHCRCGLVFSYTDLGYEKAEKERKRELLQVFRRGVLRVNLGPMPTTEDVKAMVESYGLPWAEVHEEQRITARIVDTPFDALRQLAETEGFTAIIERIRMAHEVAANDSRESITWHDWLKAHFSILQQAKAPRTGWEKAA